jgi:hypothetical protein
VLAMHLLLWQQLKEDIILRTVRLGKDFLNSKLSIAHLIAMGVMVDMLVAHLNT